MVYSKLAKLSLNIWTFSKKALPETLVMMKCLLLKKELRELTLNMNL